MTPLTERKRTKHTNPKHFTNTTIPPVKAVIARTKTNNQIIMQIPVGNFITK